MELYSLLACFPLFKCNLKMTQMTNNKNNYASELNDPQGIDRSLLEYLKPKSEDRYSKLEAYCDLLTRATSGTYSTSVVVGNLKILPGQFVATISELARKWQW